MFMGPDRMPESHDLTLAVWSPVFFSYIQRTLFSCFRFHLQMHGVGKDLPFIKGLESS